MNHTINWNASYIGVTLENHVLFFKNEKRASEDVNINTPATHTDENNKEEEKLEQKRVNRRHVL